MPQDAANLATPETAKNPRIEIKFDTDGKAVAYYQGHEPMGGYKIKFRGDRLWKLLFVVFLASRFVLVSSAAMSFVTNLYAEYPVVIQIGVAAVLLFTTFSIKRRFEPLF